MKYSNKGLKGGEDDLPLVIPTVLKPHPTSSAQVMKTPITMATRNTRIVFDILALDDSPKDFIHTHALPNALYLSPLECTPEYSKAFREQAVIICRAQYAECMNASYKKCISCGSSATTVSMSPMSYIRRGPDPFHQGGHPPQLCECGM